MENKDWKPEVGEKVWVVAFDGIHEMIITKIYWESWFIGTIAHHPLTKQYNAEIGTEKPYQTAEAALASIKIYDLEGKEVVVPHGRSIFLSICDIHRIFMDEASKLGYAYISQDSAIFNIGIEKWREIERAANLRLGTVFKFKENDFSPTYRIPVSVFILEVYDEYRKNNANGGKSNQIEGGC